MYDLGIFCFCGKGFMDSVHSIASENALLIGNVNVSFLPESCHFVK